MVIGAPISVDIAFAISSIRATVISRSRRSSARRSALGVSEKVSNARRAAVTARSTSVALPSDSVPMAVLVAGFMIGMVLSEAGSTHAPSI